MATITECGYGAFRLDASPWPGWLSEWTTRPGNIGIFWYMTASCQIARLQTMNWITFKVYYRRTKAPGDELSPGLSWFS